MALPGVAVLPLLMALVQASGFCRDDPALYFGYIALGATSGWLTGYPHIDGDIAYTTQALGHLAATDWLRGIVPWWNPYSGVGLPLAGEYQPAALFPPTLLMALPNGSIWRLMALKLMAGFGVYGLLRQLGLGRLAALTGAVLYEHNGTFSWLADAPSGPAAVFPWVILGVERAAAAARAVLRGGWRLLAVAMGLMLLAGFPETAYICGLFALAWAALRLAQGPYGRRGAMAWRLFLGGGAGFALAAPQILAFLDFLPDAFVEGHSGGIAQWTLTAQAAIPSLLAPYVYGPIWGYSQWTPTSQVWSFVGGYVDALELVLAAYGFWTRRDALAWLLVIWIFLAMAKSFGLPPVADWWNFIPGIDRVFVYRYAPPSWELATLILACCAVDASCDAAGRRRGALIFAGIVLVVEIIFLLGHAAWEWLQEPLDGLHDWLMISTLWALLTSGLALPALIWLPRGWQARAIAGFLAADACVLFMIPALCAPRSGKEDLAAIRFLQRNLGLQRFFTLGPIVPNFGAYYHLASINDVYLPVATGWLDWVTANLDDFANPLYFTGAFYPDTTKPSPADELRAHLDKYEQAGVKYVVTPAEVNPFYPDFVPLRLDEGNVGVTLQPGESARGVIPSSVMTIAAPVEGFGVMIGNYSNLSDGALKFTLCAGGQCVTGSADLAGSADNQILRIPLRKPFAMPAHQEVTYNIQHVGGRKPVVLWAYPEIAEQSLTGPEGPVLGYGLRVQLLVPRAGPLPEQVYHDSLMDIYQLPAPAPYFEAASCALQVQSRTRVIADCAAPAMLVRRELFFPGWAAWVNGSAVAISERDGIFQSVKLPAGRNTVHYAYAPPYIDWAWLLFWLALAGLAGPSLMPGRWPDLPGQFAKRGKAGASATALPIAPG